MQLSFNARKYTPVQPMDNPEQFPPYELLPGRKDVNNPDAAWREGQYETAAALGWDGDENWVRERVQLATMYAKEDGTYGADAKQPKRGQGRPLVYPMIPGESAEARRLRLNRERVQRSRGAQEESAAAAALREALVAMEQARAAYEEAKLRVAQARIDLKRRNAQAG